MKKEKSYNNVTDPICIPLGDIKYFDTQHLNSYIQSLITNYHYKKPPYIMVLPENVTGLVFDLDDGGIAFYVFRIEKNNDQTFQIKIASPTNS